MPIKKQITQSLAEIVQAGHVEQVIVESADGLTKHMAFAPPGATLADAQWYAFRLTKVTAESGVVTQRKACAPGPCAATDLTALTYTED